MVRWAGVLTHALYGGVAIYLTGIHLDDLGSGTISISIITLRSFFGIINEGTDQENENIKSIYGFIDKLTWFFAFPFYTCHLWLKYGVRQEIAYIHPAVALVPLGLYLAGKDYDDASSAVVLGNAISAAYVTIVDKNWFGLGATAIFAITHGIIKFEMESENLSKEDVFNVMLGVFVLLAWW